MLIYMEELLQTIFLKAASIGCIARPKIIVQEVLSDDVEYKNLIKSKTYIEGDANPSERIAIQVAIKKAVESFGIKKFFSFHNTIERFVCIRQIIYESFFT